MEQRERPTIMDGKVIDFARSFDERDEPKGPWHISASRNAVVVHRAELVTAEDVREFITAMEVAGMLAADMARIDRGNFR